MSFSRSILYSFPLIFSLSLYTMEKSSSIISEAANLKSALSIPSYLGLLPGELLQMLEMYRADVLGHFLASRIPIIGTDEELPRLIGEIGKKFPEYLKDEKGVGSVIFRLARILSLQDTGFYFPSVYPSLIKDVVKAFNNQLANAWHSNYIKTTKFFIDKIQQVGYVPTAQELQELYITGILNPSMLIITPINPFTGIPLKAPQEYSLLEIMIGRNAQAAIEFLLNHGAAVSTREVERARSLAKESSPQSEVAQVYTRLLQVKEKQEAF